MRSIAVLFMCVGLIGGCGVPAAQSSTGDTAALGGPTAPGGPAAGFRPCPRSLPEKMGCVPGGSFRVGSARRDWKRGNWDLSALAPRVVTLSTFLIDRTEVTTAAYQACVRRGQCRQRRSNYPHMRGARQPMLKANWYDARDYCRAQGKRLPTEAEFEAASRGPKGATYPWGNAPADCSRAIMRGPGGRGCAGYRGRGEPRIPRRFRKTGSTWDVASRPAGRYGLYDMAGNAQEWVSDWFAPTLRRCGAGCRGRDPRGPCRGAAKCRGFSKKLVKGGSWYWGAIAARAAARRPYWPHNRPPHHFGFRCAKTVR